MSNIIPLGCYSLRQVLEKLGENLFQERWSNEIVNFSKNLNNAEGYGAKLYPITEGLLLGQLESIFSRRKRGVQVGMFWKIQDIPRRNGKERKII